MSEKIARVFEIKPCDELLIGVSVSIVIARKVVIGKRPILGVTFATFMTIVRWKRKRSTHYVPHAVHQTQHRIGRIPPKILILPKILIPPKILF